MRPASRLTGQLVAFAATLFAALPSLYAQAPPTQGEAFEQGKALGRTGNAAARGTISGSTAQSTVPSYTTNPPEASYFGSPGLGTQAAARAIACASGPAAADPSCTAVQFSQTNPSQRPSFGIAPTDPLL
ncbi:MAG TPA: hypothetical protein PLT85_12275, partial [Thauera aminoaromatica]|nr:hypothetical protein [Thauera aminoaromatica]